MENAEVELYNPIEEIEILEKVETYILETNKPKYNFKKLLEESCELSEVLIKMINKKPEYAPTKQHLIEELGDVIFRIWILEKSLDIEGEVTRRILDKAKKLNQYIQEGKFKGGL